MRAKWEMAKKTKLLLACLAVFFTVVVVFGLWLNNNPLGQEVMEWLFPEGVAR